MSRLVEARRGLDPALPRGLGACAPHVFAASEGSTLCPADAHPGPPRCARDWGPRRCAPKSPQSARPRRAAALLVRRMRSCLGTPHSSCTWVPVLRGVAGRGPLLAALGTSWASLAAGRPRALALALSMAAWGTSTKGPQGLPPLQASLGHLPPQWQGHSSLPPGLRPRWADLMASTPEGITAHWGVSRPSLCPSARTPGHLAGWSGRLAGETQRSLLEPKLFECVVCSSLWLPGGARLGGGAGSPGSTGTRLSAGEPVTRPPSQEGPGPLQRLLEGPRGQGALPCTGSRCCAGPEPGRLRVEGGAGGWRGCPGRACCVLDTGLAGRFPGRWAGGQPAGHPRRSFLHGGGADGLVGQGMGGQACLQRTGC